MKDHRKIALAEIEAVVCRDRKQSYGDAEDNFANISKIASIALGKEFTPADVAVFMVCVKLARLRTSPKYRDNWIDLAGYAVCGVSIVEGQREREDSAAAKEVVGAVSNSGAKVEQGRYNYTVPPRGTIEV